MSENNEKIRLLGLSEAAEMFRISPATLYRMARQPGKVPHYRIGSQYFFDPDELMSFFYRKHRLEDVI